MRGSYEHLREVYIIYIMGKLCHFLNLSSPGIILIFFSLYK